MSPPALAVGVAPFGVEGLDLILGGGLPRERLYLLQGDPGSGKTTLGLQYLLEGVRVGESGLYVTLSETEDELRGVADSHGWSLDGITLHQLSSPEELLEAQHQNTLFHPAEVELHETIAKVLKLIDQTKPRRIVFDSLSEMRLLAGDSLRYRRQILALKQHFVGRKTTVLFLDDGTSDAGDVHLQSIAHGVIHLEKTTPDYGAARRRLEIVKLRGVEFQSGKHDFAIRKGGAVVFPRLVASSHKQPFAPDRLRSDVPALDALLGGGLAKGTSTVLLGPAGSGKTSLATQYVGAAIARGEGAALFTFDENLGIVEARCKAMGVPMTLGDGPGLSVRQVDPAELSPGEFAHEVRVAVEKRGVKMIVIDSLNGYLMAMPDERFLIIHMHELLTYLGQQGVTTLLIVAQHGLVGTMAAPVDVTYLADTVVLFRFFEAQGKVRKAISVLKKRVGGHEDTIREFQVGGGAVKVGDALSKFRGILTGTPQFEGTGGALLGESE